MSEITKLYENAEVNKQIPKVCSSNELYCKECEAHIEDAMPYCKNAEYPPFTAEKQLSLIKWLMVNNKDYQYDIEDNKYWFIIDDYRETKYREFNEALAELINLYWQDLTEQERTEIRRILNG